MAMYSEMQCSTEAELEKLPTASAVVADVVDEARHLNRSIMAFWSSKKLELTDISNSSRKFFVRVKGTPEQELAKVQEVFGKVQPVVVADVRTESSDS